MVAQQREEEIRRSSPPPPASSPRRRPLSASSSMSSSSSSTSSSSHKKSYLASIESLEDQEEEEQQRRPWDPGLSLTDRVLLEITDTERTYVRDLEEIIEGYLKHLTTGDFAPPATLVEPERLAELFSNIEDIWNFNSHFLSELEQCGLDPVAVAGCFVRNGGGFDIYTHYCTNYPRTVSLLTGLMGNPQTAEIFKERQISLRHSLPLGSYLLKPVQRILKYHLLLQNLVKHYADKEGCEEIKNALSAMTGIASHINSMKKKHEHAVRVQEIQSLLLGWEGKDLTTFGELVAEGMFRMLRAKAYRHLFLFDKMLLIAKKKDEVMLSYKTHIMCSNLMLIESIQGDPLCFHVIPFDNPRFQYTFQTRSVEQKREWCLQLKRVILENYHAVIPTHARQLVMELGQTRHSAEGGGEKSCRKHLPAPEYLERRKQERRKSEVSSSSNRSAGFRLKKGLRKIGSHSTTLEDGSGTPKMSPSSERKLEEDSHIHPNRSWNGTTLGTSFYDFQSLQRSRSTAQCDQKQNRQSWNEETSDTEGEETDRVGGNSVLAYRPSLKSCDSRASDGSLDPSGEYVTFLFAHTYACRDMEVDPLVEEKTKRSKHADISASQSLDRVSSCENLTCTTRDEPASDMSSSNAYSPGIRRAQSFSSMDNSSYIKSEDDDPKPPELPPKRFPLLPIHRQLSCHSNVTEDLSPTAPEKWLTQQQEHLATASNKCGSLPRSFQIGTESDTLRSLSLEYDYRMRNRSGIRSPIGDQRPHTIASDVPQEKEFFDGVHKYPQRDRTDSQFSSLDQTEANSSKDAVEMDDNADSTIHPEHKIYFAAASKYSAIKNVFHNVGCKLAGLKANLIAPSEVAADLNACSHGKLGRTDSHASIKSEREITPKLLTSRLVSSMSKAYSSMIKNKSKKNMDAAKFDLISAPPVVVATKMFSPHFPGSKAIGARMASPLESEYCVPKSILTPSSTSLRKNKLKDSVDEEETRPDSLFSESSNGSSNSEGDFKTSPLTYALDDDEDTPSEASEASADSYYERTFEAIENALNEDMFRDSAIYSDPEDADLGSHTEYILNPERISHILEDDPLETVIMDDCPSPPPPPPPPFIQAPPLKRINESISERLKLLEQNLSGSTKCDPLRKKVEVKCWGEEESETSSEHSISTVCEASRPCSPSRLKVKGWVKQVVEKLQSENSTA